MPSIEVAGAVLLRNNGEFLLAQRPARTVYAGYWEFPGGKIEPGEMPIEALRRELHEELGIEVQHAYPWLGQTFIYPHATVRLHFFRVTDWRGVPSGLEGQRLMWQRPGAVEVAPLLPANTSVLRALMLPTEYAISNASAVGERCFLEMLQRRFATGLRLVQLREPTFDTSSMESLATQALALSRTSGAKVLINGDVELAVRMGADGVHLSARQLMQTVARPAFELVGASVHSVDELRHAEKLGVDFAVLGAVHSTPTHPGAASLGWERFRDIARDASLPVYAIGGMRPDDLDSAWSNGAHGIAMIRGSWDARN